MNEVETDNLVLSLQKLVRLINGRKRQPGMYASASDQSQKHQAAEKAAVHQIFQEVHGRKAVAEEVAAILADRF